MKSVKKICAIALLLVVVAGWLSACGEEAKPTSVVSPSAAPNPSPTFNSSERVTQWSPTPRVMKPYPTLPPNASNESRILATIAISRQQGQGLATTPTPAGTNVQPTGVSQPKVIQIETDSYRPKIEFTELPTLADGVPVLISFDAVWCSFCSDLQPQLTSLKTQFANQIRFANLNFAATANQNLIQRYKIISAPTTLLVDKTGTGRKSWVGLIPPGELEQALKDILATR